MMPASAMRQRVEADCVLGSRAPRSASSRRSPLRIEVLGEGLVHEAAVRHAAGLREGAEAHRLLSGQANANHIGLRLGLFAHG
jgi:hypothetical protein